MLSQVHNRRTVALSLIWNSGIPEGAAGTGPAPNKPGVVFRGSQKRKTASVRGSAPLCCRTVSAPETVTIADAVLRRGALRQRAGKPRISALAANSPATASVWVAAWKVAEHARSRALDRNRRASGRIAHVRERPTGAGVAPGPPNSVSSGSTESRSATSAVAEISRTGGE